MLALTPAPLQTAGERALFGELTRWDTGGPFTIRPMVRGLEETAVLDLASPPSGAPLVSALGDIGGFHHASLDAFSTGARRSSKRFM